MDIGLLKSTFAGNVGTKPTSLKPVASPHTKQPTTILAGDVPQISGTLFKMIHPAKSLTVQRVLTRPVVLDKAAGKKALNRLQQQAESRIPGKSARLVAGSNLPSSPQTPSLIAQAAKPITSEPDQIVSTTTKPVNKPIQPTIDQGRIKSEIILPGISNKLPISDTQFEKDKDTGKMQVSDKAFVAKEKLVNHENGKESTPKTLISNNKITADSEQSVVTNKPFVPDSPKTQLSNATFAAPLGQSSHSQHKVLIGQESPAPAAEETTPNKAAPDQKDHRGKTELFELSEKNRVQVGNLSVKSIAQKMNPQRTQLSAPQIENHNNLLSNHGSNPDMEQGEQVLVGGNVQPGITEQSPTLPASVAFAKTAGNTDSGASVSEQIQESIHSSLRPGSRQIVIRLNPPELGKVAIKFTEQGDGIIGLLQVDKPQTRGQIQQVLPEIIQNLQDCGIAIKKLEVVLTNQQEQQTLKDQSSTARQDNWYEQQSSPNPESQRNNMTYNEWLTSIDNGTEFAEPQVQLTDNSINILI